MSQDGIQHTIKDETVFTQLMCRICATEPTDDDCMNNLLTSTYKGLYFVDILQDCLQRSIARDNGFPLNICLDCTSNLILVYNFRLTCDGSEKKFREMLGHQWDADALEQKVEVVIDDSESDVKPSELPTFFMDCASIDVPRTNGDEVIDTGSEINSIKPQLKPQISKPKVQNYECYLCKAMFTQTGQLRNHLTNYHRTVADKSWSCTDCHKRYSHRKKLVEHFYKHISTNCEHCSKAFAKLRDLQKHYQQTHKDLLTLHQCDRCPKKFVLKDQLRIHMHNHLDSHNKQFDCNVCSEIFVSKMQLKQHNREVHSSHLCSECGKTFKNNSLLASHQKVHKSEKPFVCPKCPSRFKWRVALTYHMTIHQQDRKHVCETCGMSFTTRTAMRGHAKIHTGERPYACDKCPKRFLRRTHLKRHNLSHTGEKPHLCKYCDKGFRQSAQLNKHLRLHVGENTYQCDLCPKKFKLKAEMKRHEYEHYERQDFKSGTVTKES